MSEPVPAPVLTYKAEALIILREWQAEVAADRGIHPTEANAAELYAINNVINTLDVI